MTKTFFTQGQKEVESYTDEELLSGLARAKNNLFFAEKHGANDEILETMYSDIAIMIAEKRERGLQ